MNTDILYKRNDEINKSNIFAHFYKNILHPFLTSFFMHVVYFVLFLMTIGGSAIGFIIWIDIARNPYGNYEMVYRVYYTPTNVKEYTVRDNRPIHCESYNGSNKIRKHKGEIVIETSAPIEVVRYVNYTK